MTVDCPLDCEYLREARVREKAPPIDAAQLPNQDIRVSEQFLRDQEPLLLYTGSKLLEAVLETSGSVDGDAQEALESLIRTYRTLESGLYYETRPSNPVAGNIHYRLQQAVQELRKKLSEEGSGSIRDADVLGVLIFFQRLGFQNANGRRRGRAFIDHLREFFPQVEKSIKPPQQALIQV